MHFSGSIAVFVALATAAAAQDNQNFATICTLTNMQGTCGQLQGGNNVCINLDEIGWGQNIGSIQQVNAVSCSFWLSSDCSGSPPVKGAKGTGVINPQGGDYRGFRSARCTNS